MDLDRAGIIRHIKRWKGSPEGADSTQLKRFMGLYYGSRAINFRLWAKIQVFEINKINKYKRRVRAQVQFYNIKVQN